MSEPHPSLADLSAADLERALADVGRRLAYPATPDLAPRVAAQLRAEPAPPTPLPFPRRRLMWLAAALALLVIAGTLVLFPQARSTIADRLGLRGILIRWEETTPRPAPSPVGARLLLGRQTTLDEARAALDFAVMLPTVAGLADPPEVYLSGENEDAMLSFVYPASPELPSAAGADVGALLTQFRGRVERDLIEKGLSAQATGAAARLEAVDVAGRPGYWISGAPHAVFFVCPDVGECRQERYRLAGNVLLWEQEGTTLRLESDLPLEESLAIAESVRALE